MHFREFVLKQEPAVYNGATNDTLRLSGWLNGRRILRKFKDRDEALSEKNRLEVEMANRGELQVRATRLSAVQHADAELAIARLGRKSLTLAVDWFLTTYKPPASAIAIETVTAAFPSRAVHSISTADIQRFMANRGIRRKRFNNLRGEKRRQTSAGTP